MTLTDEAVTGAVPAWRPELLATVEGVRSSWRPIVMAAEPRTRCDLALDLWNADFLAGIPRFAQSLRDRLLDVRVAVADEAHVLIYLLHDDAGELAGWVGYDPDTFGDEPPFWEAFPAPLATFLTTVHAGFVSDGRSEFGPNRPRMMRTMADLAQLAEGELPELHRMLRISTRGNVIDYCVSPDLGPGELAVLFQGDVDDEPWGETLDQLFMRRLEG